MFSNLWNFICVARGTMEKQNYRITMIQARDGQFASMSRSQLLKLRDACFSFANDITAHLTALDYDCPKCIERDSEQWLVDNERE